MKGLRLYKKEKLCSEIAIDALFARNSNISSALAYPLRATWRHNPRRRSDAPIAFLISIPKKRLRHAVDRVTMRRRVREAYRLCRHNFKMPTDARIDLAFIYVADRLTNYQLIEKAVNKIMAQVQATPILSSANEPSTLDQ